MTYNEEEVKELFDVVFKLSAKDINDKLIKVRNRPEIAQKRWFWELLQNAKDAVKAGERVSVKLIIGSENGQEFVDFQHNGNPFRYQDAKNLIFPYSDKGEEENSDKSGRFGTGFLATHILSKKIKVTGIYLKAENNQAFNFSFTLDRSESTKLELAQSISKTWQEFKDNSLILPNYQYNTSNFETSFKYELDAEDLNLTNQSIIDFSVSLPFVLAFIPKIESVHIIDQHSNSIITYQKIDALTKQLTDNIKQICIEKKTAENEKTKTESINVVICSDNIIDIAIETYSLNGQIFIKEFANHQPLLFCPFPLIGGTDFKFPLIVNNTSFLPKEERDGIWLADTIEGKTNQNIFEKALPLFESLVTFVSTQNWKNTYLLLKSLKENLEIADLNSKWFADKIQTPIKNFITQVPLVDTDTDERLPIYFNNEKIYFPSEFKEEIRLQLWDFMKTLFPNNIAKKLESTNWYSVIWDDCPKMDIISFTKYISSFKSIQGLQVFLSTSKDETVSWLNDVVSFVNKEKPALLNEKDTVILPNQFGIFKKRDELFLDDGTIGTELKEILADISRLKTGITDWRDDMLEEGIFLELPAIRTKTLALVGTTISETVKDLLKEENLSNEHRNVFSLLLNWLYENPYKAKEHFKGIRVETLLYKTASESKIKHITDLLQKDRDGQLSVEDLSNIDSTKIALLKNPDVIYIMTLEESDLKELAKLAQKENFSAILNAADLILQQQQYDKTDFRHKYEIGIYIENLIREKLSSELKIRVTFDNQKTEVTNTQGGQDIIILLDNKPIYFIEVKSRWDNQKSISMSKLQLQRAVEEFERYALCAVDITRYKGETDRYKLSIDEILPITKFVMDIGNPIKSLIKENLEAEKNQDQFVFLTDYRGIIPQDIIQKGNDFNSFIKFLLQVIDKNLSN
ncbi:DUF3883 domain-containing protein [uncultured Chryseobacterium sp.]|uniref:sacsin N-terminal ATP-binding-like domain-containing protein n=1 Tax=uncultured Chryseobacterium sp. TaxID=259322 RepID=UPI0025F8270B|nr:DUF3883 domain-containing protein [uncultured Chryseobacterium sp.]